jgi:hypothetical protein
MLDVPLDQTMNRMSTLVDDAAVSGDSNSFAQALMTTTSLFPATNETAAAEAEGQMRGQLLQSVGTMTNSTYATTADTVQQQAQLTREVCTPSNPGVLDGDTQARCAEYAEDAAAKALTAELTPATAQAVVDTFSTLVTTEGSRGGDKAAKEAKDKKVAKSLKSTCKSLGRGMLAKSVAGEDPALVDAEGLQLEAAILPSDLSRAAVGGGGVVLGGGVAGLLGGQEAGSTHIKMADNIYEYAAEPNASESVSGIVSFSLFSPESGQEFVVEGLHEPIQIVIAHEAIADWSDGSTNGTLPGCWYWDEEADGWANDGCVVNFNDTNYDLSSPTQTVCLCTHLTEFNAKAGPIEIALTVNTISMDDVLNFTWENLVRDE